MERVQVRPMEKELKHNSIKRTDSATVITGTDWVLQHSIMVLGAGPLTPLRVYRQLIVAGGRGGFFSVIATSKCLCSCKWSFTHDLVSDPKIAKTYKKDCRRETT